MKVLKVEFGKRFKLPFLGKESFSMLMRYGLNYDRKSRMFYVDSNTDLISINELLKSRGIRIEIVKKCAICGVPIDCDKCDFSETCRKEQAYCICDKCLKKNDIFNAYVEAQKKFLGY